MEPILKSIAWSDTQANIKLFKYFNLYPKIQLYIDVPKDGDYGVNEQTKKIFKIYSDTYDVSDCATDISIKTTIYNNCGQLNFKLIHKDCQKLFRAGCRVRLYLDDRCWFCGWIFTTQYEGEEKMSITCFDWLRYFKVPLIYGKNQVKTKDGKLGLVGSDIFTKICQDLAIPFNVQHPSKVPITPQNYTRKTAFQILEFAIQESLINSAEEDRQYFMYMHDTFFEDDLNKEMKDTEIYKTSGRVTWYCRNELTVDTIITDELLYNYNFEESIDKNTFNEIIVYKQEKSYVGKNGKTLKKGKKTGTEPKKIAPDNYSKGLYGYLPYYHKAPDSYSEAQMQQVADQLLKVLNRPSQSISLDCYGIIGMRAGYLVPVNIKDIAGTSVNAKVKNEDTGEIEELPVYRTVRECEMKIQHPLKMTLKLSAGMFSEAE